MRYALICDSNCSLIGLFPITSPKIMGLEDIVNEFGFTMDILTETDVARLAGYRLNPLPTILRTVRYAPRAFSYVGRTLPKVGKKLTTGAKKSLKQTRKVTKEGTKLAKEGTKLATAVGAGAVATELAVDSVESTDRS